MAYPTEANLKTFLSISASSEDTQLGWALDAAIKLCERKTGRIFVAATETRYFSAKSPNVGRNKKVLSLFDDLCDITSVTNGDATAFTLNTHYRAFGTRGNNAPWYKLEILPNQLYSWQNGADGTEIAIVGSWGYSTTCPDAIFEAILRLAAHNYRARSVGQGGAVTAVSKRAGLAVGAAEYPQDVMDEIMEFKR
jgi:uncharacterized phiE125 gp8 family phage protein